MKGKSNPVAKHLRTFNKATVQRDRKKDSKKGISKYKKDIYKEEGDLEKARDNVGSDSCWDGYKATSTKKKGGKLVPDCKKESVNEGADRLISSYVRGDLNLKTVRRGTSMSSPIFVKVTGGKKDHEMGPYKSAAEAKKAVNKMHPAPKGKRTMKNIDEGFSKAQIDTLKKEYSTLTKINPTGPAYKKMRKFLEGRSEKELEGIAKAKIKFLSQTAASVLQDKHGVKLKFSDYWSGSESVDHISEGISVEQFDRLKSKQKVTIDFSSVMGGSGEKEFIVTRKSKLKGGKIEKITLKSVKNPIAQASYLYKRDGKVAMAQGDMAVSAKSLKEGMRVEPYDVNALMEKAVEIQYTDKPDFGEDSALGYGRKEGYKEVGVIGTSARTAMVIFKLNAFDKKYTKSVRLKAGEEVFRYTSRGTVAGKIMPLIKVNMKRGLAYYLTQESSSGEIDEPVFETKSQKLKFIRLLTSAYKPGHIVKEDVEQIDEIVAKLNKNGEVEMTKKKYAKVHRDFKGKWPDGEHYVTQHMGKQGMTQVPVKFVREDVEQFDEKMDRETKKTARSLMRLGDNPRLAVKTAKAGAKKGSASKAAYRKAYEDVDQVDENQDIKATAPKAKATKVGQRATTPSDMGRTYPDNKWVVKKNTATSKAYRPLEWVLESAEQVDELSVDTLSRYNSKASKDPKRAKMNNKAVGKIVKKTMQGESVEQVDEIRFTVAKTAAGSKYKAKKAQQYRDSSPDKYMPGVVDRKKASDKARKKGVSARPVLNYNRKLPESAEQVDELTQREKEMIADRKAKRETKAGRKDKKTRLIPKTTTYVRPSKGEDDHIVMQLRKAQDSANFGNSEFDIRVSPVKGAATVQLKKPQIDKLLNVYDKLEKPDQKRKYRITLLKTLRSMQQKGK